MNQAELEWKMVQDGIDQQYLKFHEATEGDNIDRHPALARLLGDWVEPLAALIQRDRDNMGLPQRTQVAIRLLLPLDPVNIAFLAVRQVIRACVHEDPVSRALAVSIGGCVHSELYLSKFEQDMGPDLFYTISKEMGRRGTKSGDYKYKAFRKIVNDRGIEFTEWSPANLDQVGCYLLEYMRVLGLITWTENVFYGGKTLPVIVSLSAEVHDTIMDTERNIALTRPGYAPCIEPPHDWTALNEGGWHTREMRRLLPFCIKARPAAREALQAIKMPLVWGSINALQKTAWRVNTRVLEAVAKVARLRNVGELVMNQENDKPELPGFMADGRSDPETAAEMEAKANWKAAMTAWYTKAKAQGTARIRMAAALRQAREYRDYPRIFFVYFADSRGRLYPMAQGLNPQGTDLQKGLIEFADGKYAVTESAVRWMKINGANLWGFDKAPLDERAAWAKDNEQKILAIAADPVGNQDWLDGDNPCEFLAWCFEYAEWVADPDNFKTHLPVHLDGSCSGLQHLSAMFRDEIGGKSTNLTYSSEKQDIYRDVAELAMTLLQVSIPSEENQHIHEVCLAHPMDRAAVKRWVMTTPYGVTKASGIKYLANHYEQDQATAKDCFKIAAYLATFVEAAIASTIVKGAAAMGWLKRAGKEIAKSQIEYYIGWYTPSGFYATQSYYESKELHVSTHMYGHRRIKVMSEGSKPSVRRHGAGMAPNFVHSMDASHLHLVACRMAREVPGASLAFIHDSFGTHASETQRLYDALRDEFVLMYENSNPVAALASGYWITELPPERGDLDLAGVRASQFVFS